MYAKRMKNRSKTAGGAENAGPEMQDRKMQDWKMQQLEYK